MQWVDVLIEPLEKDLSGFSRFLSNQGIEHRIIERDGKQVLLAPVSYNPEHICAWLKQWNEGIIQVSEAPPQQTVSYFKWLFTVRQYPVVLATVLLAILGWMTTTWAGAEVLRWFTFQDTLIDEHGRTYIMASTSNLEQWQWWRIITPTFLHFGLLHLLFNTLWTIEFGRRIEAAQTSYRLITIILATGAISNLCQYVYQPDHLFGGLSGVVYGLLGYCWLWGRHHPQSRLAPPPGVMKFLLIWLIICMTGVLSVIDIHIANAAHVGGLVSGLLLAWIELNFKTRLQNNDNN